MTPKILTPTVTIFRDDGHIDIEGNLRLMDALIDAGIDGFVPLGSTGEFPFAKDNEEKKAYLARVIRHTEGRAELLVGTGGISPEKTVELSNFVLEKGVKGVLIISESYFNMSPDDFYRYYAYMAENIHRDVYIYNFPARTGSSIDADTVLKLVKKYPNIKGMKDSVLDFEHTASIMRKVLPVRPDFEMFSGYDHHFVDNHQLGGAGGVGALSNVAPKVWSAWVKATRSEDEAGMAAGLQRIKELFQIYSLESNPHKLIKEILVAEGLNINTFSHFPYNELKPDSVATALAILGEDADWL
jgi:4-hydroxy-tetrahydrodipicolinate synthase